MNQSNCLVYIASPHAMMPIAGMPGRALVRLKVSQETRKELERYGYILTFTQARRFAYKIQTTDIIQPFASLCGEINESMSNAASIVSRYRPARIA